MSRHHLLVSLQMTSLGNWGNVLQQARLRACLKATLFILGGHRQCSFCFPWLVLQALFFLPGSHKKHLKMLKFSQAVRIWPDGGLPGDLFRLRKVKLTGDLLPAACFADNHLLLVSIDCSCPALCTRDLHTRQVPPPCSWDPDSGIIMG